MCVIAIGTQKKEGGDMGERSQEVLGLELCVCVCGGGGEGRGGCDSFWLTSPQNNLHARHFTCIISNI